MLASAAPGVYSFYPFDIVVLDEITTRPLGQEPMTLVVVPRGLPESVASRLKEARRLYKKYGGQAHALVPSEKYSTGRSNLHAAKTTLPPGPRKRVSNGTVRRAPTKNVEETDTDREGTEALHRWAKQPGDSTQQDRRIESKSWGHCSAEKGKKAPTPLATYPRQYGEHGAMLSK